MSKIPFKTDSDYDQKVMGFLHECLQEGQAFLKAQPGFDKIQLSIDAISGENSEFRSPKLSSTNVNHLAKINNDLVAGMTDVRPFMQYVTGNPAYQRMVDSFGLLSEHWWYKRNMDLRLSDIIRYVNVAGTGYAHMVWNSAIQDIECIPEDPRDVLPIRPSSNISIQEAAGVIVRRARTVNYLRRQYSEDKWHLIKADRDMSSESSYGSKLKEKLAALASPFYDALFGSRAQRDLPKVPVCDTFTMYLTDDRIHEGDVPLFMGEFSEEGKELTPWSYIVRKGEPVFPNKRMMIFTRYGVLYDGPSPYWHGLFPLAKLTLDPHPWQWMGKGLLWDLLPLQGSLDSALRAWDDWVAKVVRPDIIADKNSISKQALEKLDSRKAGLKILQNPLAGKGITIQPPPNLPQDFWKGIDFLINQMDDLSGIANLQGMMRLNQMPSSDTIERIAEKMSPSIRLRSRNVECFIREIATILGSDFLQFYTLPMRLRKIGARGVTEFDFDFDPHNMIPAFTDRDRDEFGVIRKERLAEGPRSRMERAKELMETIEYHITPGSLLAQSDMMEQMKYLQLYRMQALDLWTLLDKLKVPDIGEKPAGTIMDRIAQQYSGGFAPMVSAVGRKATGQEPPKMKSSGAISESG